MSREVVLTGITTTGTPHLGNYVGAIRPAIEASHNKNVTSYYFLADYHALIKNSNPKLLQQSTFEIAATWLACGLDPEKVVFYRQSDIPEIMELTWMLTCMSSKGLMNRSHAYKAIIQANEQNGKTDLEEGVTMGLFCYPVLMAADILMFKANKVPVGKDQIQHIEMARDMAQRFNHYYGELLVLPQSVIDQKSSVLSGLDGRKMSKSYNNTIPLFLPEKKLRKMIMKIVTNS
ncbi:MAG: tryptophan--tRNA ligase, partial [Gammaproteobacteria bacterium]|nr:tryptophan--tRNA ligase [Gammaproteobacteria bacterium]